MRVFWLILGLSLLVYLPLTAQTTPDSAWYARVVWRDRSELQALAARIEPLEVRDEDRSALILVDDQLAERLRRAGFRLSFERPVPENDVPTRIGEGGIPGFPCYPTVDETQALLSQWAVAYPDLVEVIDIGDSWVKEFGDVGGDDLRILKITRRNQVADKAPWFAMGALHAREYTTAALLTRYAEELLTGYGHDPDITWQLDYGVFHFFLIANPDGRREAEDALLWRKNANNIFCPNSNRRGVDLNRNFSFEWGCCFGSSPNDCDETFRGLAAASEPEITALTQYVRAHFPDNRGPELEDGVAPDASGVFLDIHSFGQFVLWPFGFSNTDSADNETLQRLGRKLAFFNGYRPEKASQSFVTDGTSDDWAYGELGLAAFTFELGTSFFQSCQLFEETVLPDNLQALRYSARVARAPFALPAGPELTALNLDRDGIAPGDPLTVTVTADDTRFSDLNGTEPASAISAVRMTVDNPPWLAHAEPVALEAADGDFDTAIETAQIQWTATDLKPGRRTLFLQAQDAEGAWGPVSAAFFSFRVLTGEQITTWPEPSDVTDLVTILNALN